MTGGLILSLLFLVALHVLPGPNHKCLERWGWSH